MSDFQQRDGTGQLFRNDKATSEKHPSHKGTFLLNGVTYEIAAWVKDGKRGRFFSLKVSEAGNRGAQDPAPSPSSVSSNPVRTRTPGELPMPPTGGRGPRRPVQDDDQIPFAAEVR